MAGEGVDLQRQRAGSDVQAVADVVDRVDRPLRWIVDLDTRSPSTSTSAMCGPSPSQARCSCASSATRAVCWPRASSFPRRSWTSSDASSNWTERSSATTRCGPRPRHEHLAELRRLYGFRSFSGGAARELVEGLHEEAPQAQSNEDLVRRFVEACRRTRTILPATTTIERLCADALVDAERRIEARIAERVPPGLRRDLEHLLEETVDAGVTRFVWLRQFEPEGFKHGGGPPCPLRS